MAQLPQDENRSFDFSYAPAEAVESDQEVQLPFRLLVLGEFLPDQSQEVFYNAEPAPVSLRNFNRLLSAQNICLTVPLAALSLGDTCRQWFVEAGESLSFRLHSLEDFNPEMLAQREPTLAKVQGLLVQVQTLKIRYRERSTIDLSTITARDRGLLGLPEGETAFSRDVLDFLLTDVAASLNELLNRIIHYPPLQKLEAAWRGLHLLAQTAGDNANCQVCFLPVSIEMLREDLGRASDLIDSRLFDVLYANEYGQFGGKPYGAVIADYAFELNDADIALMRRLAILGSTAHAPVISKAAPSFFGVKEYGDLANLSSLKGIQTGERYIKWRAFQSSPEAMYLVLTLPRILLRNLYSVANGNVNASLYEEDIGNDDSPYLWGNAAYALGTCLLRSFQRHGICTDITGDEGGEVLGLPHLHLKNTSDKLLPVEVLFSENKEAELIGLGFTPLSVAKAQDKVLFYAANSVFWGALQSHNEQSVIEHLGAQLPYLFVILRIAHYLKMICRDMIGSVASVAELEAQLQRWLKRYVSDVESPSPSVRLRRPLKKVELKVGPDPRRADWLAVDLAITPHLKYMDQDFTLKLNLNITGQR